jgi:hypothetical protein
MAGLVPAINVFLSRQDADGRNSAAMTPESKVTSFLNAAWRSGDQFRW